ncbi:MAG: zeta toxin family protein [Clostridia bacterium]|nr:zeta toxin family protein [Clostridia bacterium]
MRKPEIVVIAGPNGSGKSTYTEFIVGPNQFADETFEYINADNIQAAVGCDAIEAARTATAMREKALSENRNFAFETVMSTRRNLDLLIKAKENGYFIRCFYFLTADPYINIQRVLSRVEEGGHPVPEDKIKTRYERAKQLIPELVAVCDSINIWDNSTEQPCRIFRKKPDAIDYFENPVWSLSEVENLTGLILKGN